MGTGLYTKTLLNSTKRTRLCVHCKIWG